MIRTIAFIVLALAACSKDKPSTTPTGGGDTAATGSDSPEVDPTLPSWAPASCAQYHKLAIQVGECTAIAQADRDAVTQKYETRQAEWKALQNTEQAQLDAVKKECDDAVTELTAKKSASCP